MSNEIIRPVTPDGNAGYDSYNQFWIRERYGDGEGWTASVYADLRNEKCVICGKGWELTAKGLKDQHQDSTFNEWMHKTCFIGHLTFSEGHSFTSMLCRVRDQMKLDYGFHLEKIPNEYGGAWNTPWYLVSIRGLVPKIKMGSRKRVTNMELLDLTHDQARMFEPMLDEKDLRNTNEARRTSVPIHAWNDAEIMKYLGYFFKILMVDRKKPEEETGSVITELKK